MQKKAAKKSKLLAEKQEDADRALAQITQSMTGAKEQRVSMEQLRVETEKESQVIEEQKRLIEDQLKEARLLVVFEQPISYIFRLSLCCKKHVKQWAQSNLKVCPRSEVYVPHPRQSETFYRPFFFSWAF